MMTDILDKFTTHLKNTLAKSYALAMEMSSPDIHPEHLLLGLLLQKGSIGGEILRKSSLGAEEVRHMLQAVSRYEGEKDHDADSPKLSAESRRVIEKAVLCANANQHKYVGTEHLLSGIIQIESPVIAAILTDQEVDIEDLDKQVGVILKSTSKFPEITETFEIGQPPVKAEEAEQATAKTKEAAKKKAKQKTPALDFFSVDLTDPKVQEHIDPVIGREREIERMIQILSRRTKNNPVLLGEPGVGKTAIIEGLAKRVVQGDVPEALSGKRILAVDLGLIVAGTIYRGEFEGRLKQIIDEVKANPDLILFIDELHTIMGAGSTSGSMDAANILKPALARGDMRCIGATTIAEFKKHIESDGALERRFQPIAVDEPSADVAISILRGLKSNYESYHGVTIEDDAIEAAVRLSERYIPDRQLPDKAIDLIDESAACVKVAASGDERGKKVRRIEEDLDGVRKKKEKAVKDENFIDALELKTREKDLEHELRKLEQHNKAKDKAPVGNVSRRDVAGVISRATGIPLTDLLAEEKARLLQLESLLKTRVIGQDDAVTSVAEMVRRAKAGISHPHRPLASFLFLGPSGVGKTELAKALAELVFHDPNALVRIDMSEFSEGFNISKLIGAPAGYVGYREETKLTDLVKRRPHSLVLFDEIEKAHGDVHNLLLQILEDGHVTDATGRKINFKNTIVVMTSNVGANVLGEAHVGFSVGEGGEPDAKEVRSDITQELERAFRPEFINRIDRTVIFSPLSKTVMTSIVDLQMQELANRVAADHAITLKTSAAALKAIAEKSWSPQYGARTVRRQIQEVVEGPLAQALLADKYGKGDVVTVNAKDGEFTLTRSKKTTASTKKKAHAANKTN